MYVYRFLNDKDEIIYIGRTKNLLNRMNYHNHLPKECYDETYKIEYSILNNDDESAIYERYYINKYSPKYNSQYNNNSIFRFLLPDLIWNDFDNKVEKDNFYIINMVDISKMKLTMEEKGVYISLIEKLSLDGTYVIQSHHTSFKGYGEEFGISKNRIKGVLEGLMDKKLIWFDRPNNILINPKYYRYGNHIKNQKAIEVFKIDIE